jgi:hypothetical protein
MYRIISSFGTFVRSRYSATSSFGELDISAMLTGPSPII